MRSLPISPRRQLTPSNACILAIQLFLDFIDQLIGHDTTARRQNVPAVPIQKTRSGRLCLKGCFVGHSSSYTPNRTAGRDIHKWNHRSRPVILRCARSEPRRMRPRRPGSRPSRAASRPPQGDGKTLKPSAPIRNDRAIGLLWNSATPKPANYRASFPASPPSSRAASPAPARCADALPAA